VDIYNLIYEITRRCNARCEHCLRGPAQKVDMSDEIINRSLEGVGSISTITFTGGEPSLAVDRIRYILKAVKERGICVDSFYLVTNGKVKSLDLCLALMEWYAYCDSNEMSSLCISKDQYHTREIESTKEAHQLYQALSFYNAEERNRDIEVLINEGRAKTKNIGEREAFTGIDYETNEDGSIEHIEEIYVNALGDVCTGCDLSFGSQKKNAIGSVLTDTIEQIYLKQESIRVNHL
jgi:organic radical activating enzyme